MKPDFFDILARTALSRAGRLPPARDALAPPPGARLAARARPVIQAPVRTVTRDAPADVDAVTTRLPFVPSLVPPRGASATAASRPSFRTPPPRVRTPPTMDLKSYVERRRGRP